MTGTRWDTRTKLFPSIRWHWGAVDWWEISVGYDPLRRKIKKLYGVNIYMTFIGIIVCSSETIKS